MTHRANGSAQDNSDDVIPPGMAVPCFRCGLCCTRYQAPVTVSEAEILAKAFSMSLDAFLDRYIDDSWFEPGRFLLDTDTDSCIFLDTAKDGSKTATCKIHRLRPQACQDWQAGFHKKECRDGLLLRWGLTVTHSGKLEGNEDNLREFRAFLHSLRHQT